MGKMQIVDATAPFSEKKPISIYARSTGRESSNRRSKLHQHRITKGSNSTDGGTAVTNPACKPGNTTLRLFLFWDLSVSRPTNRQVQSCRQITMRQSEVIRFAGYTARGAWHILPRPVLRPTDQTNHNEPPRRMGKATGTRGRSPHWILLLSEVASQYSAEPPLFTIP